MRAWSRLAAIIAFTLWAQACYALGDDDINVLSYYASGNSLDGQPMVDRANVLRFFPIFRYFSCRAASRAFLFRPESSPSDCAKASPTLRIISCGLRCAPPQNHPLN